MYHIWYMSLSVLPVIWKNEYAVALYIETVKFHSWVDYISEWVFFIDNKDSSIVQHGLYARYHPSIPNF